jgi:hypothetical protein
MLCMYAHAMYAYKKHAYTLTLWFSVSTQARFQFDVIWTIQMYTLDFHDEYPCVILRGD